MGQGAGIFWKLLGAKRAHIGDARDRAPAHVGLEFLIAIDGQPLLQGELKPVAACDAVAGPVVEIFMRDDRLDPLIIGVGGAQCVGEDVFCVENIEAFILHRAHVERTDRDDLKHIEVIFEAKAVFVPLHRAFECVERECAAPGIARIHIKVKIDLAP